MPFPTGRALLDPVKILQNAGLTEGQVYADFGCGTLGYFVLPATDLVGLGGKVYALDILKDALGAIQERAQAEKVLNLQTVWGDLEHEQGTKDIPEASVDLVSLVSLSGILFKKPTVIKNIKRVLKDGGCLLLVDWQPGSFLSKFLSTHQIDPKKLKNELEKNGFFLVKSFSAGLNHFGLLLQKT